MNHHTSAVRAIIENFVAHSDENTLHNSTNDRAFVNPLVGFARGDDLIFESYKDHVGSFHWTPHEIFSLTFPSIKVAPDELAVISWILPHIRETKTDNRKQNQFPAERWARARLYGEEVNDKLRKLLVQKLNEMSIQGVAPTISPLWSRESSDKFGFASRWSERHIAFACGLGTFGLCDGLITKRGKAVRVGSVVARVKVPTIQRPYTDHHAYCLNYSKGVCGKCIQRCPVGAISKKGHDKSICYTYIRQIVMPYIQKHYGFQVSACGLCQTKVPCESKIPLSTE